MLQANAAALIWCRYIGAVAGKKAAALI